MLGKQAAIPQDSGMIDGRPGATPLSCNIVPSRARLLLLETCSMQPTSLTSGLQVPSPLFLSESIVPILIASLYEVFGHNCL